jgi:uncharacterized repeat protein (TIGR03806 family)
VKQFAIAAALWAGLAAVSPPPAVNDALITGDTLPPKLSAFNLLINARTPSFGVRPYALNTALFSDYAEKYRAIYVPQGQKGGWREDGVLDFPVGSVLIKSFGYPADLRKPNENVRMLETRLLIRRASGWVALPYVWDADGKDATLARAGKRIDVSWTHLDGKPRTISYAVPNVNQCKGCHDLGGTLTPLGPKARNLNDGVRLQSWVKDGFLDQMPANAPAVPRFDDAKAPLEERARAYLDVNCGHCHNKAGPANTSGLWLDWNQPRDVNFGFGKRPTAAGRGSGDREFAIAAGHPESSYLVYRMESLDPGIAMPEIGRNMVHTEAVSMLSDWIRTRK